MFPFDAAAAMMMSSIAIFPRVGVCGGERAVAVALLYLAALVDWSALLRLRVGLDKEKACFRW